MNFSQQLTHLGPIKGPFLLQIGLKTLILPNFNAPKTPIFVCRFQFPFGFISISTDLSKLFSRLSYVVNLDRCLNLVQVGFSMKKDDFDRLAWSHPG